MTTLATISSISTVSTISTMTSIPTISTHCADMTESFSRSFEILPLNPIHLTIGQSGLRHAERTAVDLIDKLPRIDKVESIPLAEGLLTEPGIRRHLFTNIEHVLLIV